MADPAAAPSARAGAGSPLEVFSIFLRLGLTCFSAVAGIGAAML